jgi:nicotinate-nucleotide adenylyltransferase
MPMPDESNPNISAPAEKPVIVFGGSFDPVHLGHTDMLQAAMNTIKSSRAIVLPAYQSPHKAGPPCADAHHRLAMLKLAGSEMPGLIISEMEIRAAKPSYTIDSIQMLKSHYPEKDLVLLIGMDQLRALHRWHRAGDLLEQVRLLIAPRALPQADIWHEIAPHWPLKTLQYLQAACLSVPTLPVSSTEIRGRIALGQSITGLVHPAVERYIAIHALYRINKDNRNIYK